MEKQNDRAPVWAHSEGNRMSRPRQQRRPWPAAAVILIALGGLVIPAPAGASETTPVLSGILPGSGYVATKIDWTGVGDVKLELKYGATSEGMSFGAALIRPDGGTWSVIHLPSGLLGSHDCLIVRGDATGTVQDSCEASAAQQVVFPAGEDATGSVAVIVSEDDGDPAGTWTLVLWQAYRADSQRAGVWNLEIEPGQGSVLGSTTGDRAFYGTTKDFRDGQAIAASAAGAFASVNVDSHFEFHIEDVLFGIVTPDTVTRNTPGMTLHGPLGAESCTCTFLAPVPTAEAPPGDYVVELARASGGHQGFTEAIVFALDLRLP